MNQCQEPGCLEEAVLSDYSISKYCYAHGCCVCGDPMLPGTEDWRLHLCSRHFHGYYVSAAPPGLGHSIQMVINAAFAAGVAEGKKRK